MNTFTVSFATLQGLNGVAGVEVKKGITLSPGRYQDDQSHLRLGETTPRSYWTDIRLSKTHPPLIDNNKIVYNAGLFDIPHQKYPVLDKSPVGECDAILVRIKTKNQLKFNLNPVLDENSFRIVGDGIAHDITTHQTWADILVVLEPYHVVTIGTPEDSKMFGVVNSGGVAEVVTIGEYEEYFAPHVLATESIIPQPFKIPAEIKAAVAHW